MLSLLPAQGAGVAGAQGAGGVSAPGAAGAAPAGASGASSGGARSAGAGTAGGLPAHLGPGRVLTLPDVVALTVGGNSGLSWRGCVCSGRRR